MSNKPTFLTAAQARELSQPFDPEIHVREILNQVEAVAKLKKTSMRYRAYGFGDSALYSGNPTANQQAVMKQLELLGYKVRIGCEEKQFVDIFLEIDWSGQ